MSRVRIQVCDDCGFDDEIVRMYARHQYNLEKLDWLQWKYRRNPCGEPYLVLAISAGRVVGMQAHLPRVYRVDGRAVNTVEAVDAFVEPAYRRDGVYRKIWQQAKRTARDRHRVLITFPSVKGKSTGAMYSEGLQTLGRIITRARILRPEALMEQQGLHRFAHWYRKCTGPFRRPPRASQPRIDVHEVHRFEDFVAGVQRSVSGARSREYLNWKFCQNPMTAYTCVVFTFQQAPAGYAVLKSPAGPYSVYVHDCGFRDGFGDCIEALTGFVRARFPQAGCLLFSELESGPLAPALKAAGFFRVDSGQLLMLDNLGGSGMRLDPAQWLITRGDSDW